MGDAPRGVLAAVGWVWYWAEQASTQVSTIAPEALPSIDPAPPQSKEARTFLLIGSDSRERLPEDFPNFFGLAEGERADVIMVVKVIPTESRVQILSIPRDLKVEIPRYGTQKINAAYAFGGPDLMVKMVKEVIGLPIHHYVEMDFVGFAGIVDALGGVRMYFPYPARDDKSGLLIEPGCVEIGGSMALAYARSRSYQEYRDGSWVSVEADDLGRIQRQQRLIFAMIEEARRPSTITELRGLVEALGANVSADANLTTRAMVQLAWELRSLSPELAEAAALPVDFTTVGGISYVVPLEPDASRMLEALREGAPLEAAAEEGPIVVRVLNGNGLSGSAAGLAERLEGAGFVVEGVADADRQDYLRTLVIARPEELSRGHQVLEAMGFGQALPGEVPEPAQVLVILGRDAPTASVPPPTAAPATPVTTATTLVEPRGADSCG